jgi:hypothetical protein
MLNDHYQLTVTDPAAIAAAESVKARIQAAYIMAAQRPRNEDESRVKILKQCDDPRFAEKVEYNKPIGKGIKGPSIRFAEAALRYWGNIQSDTQTVYEDEKIRRIRVTVTDLETNATYSKDIQVSKVVERRDKKGREVVEERMNSLGDRVYIVKATDDELHNKEAALISKAVRNEGLRLIPSDIVDEAIERARGTLMNRDAQDPQAATKKIVDTFAMLNIFPKDLEQYLGHPLRSISPKELQDLRGIYQAIKDGETTWHEVTAIDINPETGEITEHKGKSIKDQLKETLLEDPYRWTPDNKFQAAVKRHIAKPESIVPFVWERMQDDGIKEKKQADQWLKDKFYDLNKDEQAAWIDGILAP